MRQRTSPAPRLTMGPRLDLRTDRHGARRTFAGNRSRAGRFSPLPQKGPAMPRFGFHASHEQFPPSELLRLVQVAEVAGFEAAKGSDHFKPWGPAQGQSGFAWSWLGAALARTSFPIGSITAPGYRYHPAIVAQAAATLAEMFPGRFWLALGSGQRLNEDIIGLPWPEKAERNARLRECAGIIRALLNGETVSHQGRVTVVDARLYSRPETPPPLLGAAVTEETATMIGGWADGLLTVSGEPDQVRKVLEAFRSGGGEGKRLVMQVGLSWASTEEEALRGAHDQWRTNVLGGEVNWELRSPEQFDTATKHVRLEDVAESILVSASLDQHVEWIGRYLEMGFEEIHLHNVGRNQEAFLEAFGTKVLPQLRAHQSPRQPASPAGSTSRAPAA